MRVDFCRLLLLQPRWRVIIIVGGDSVASVVDRCCSTLSVVHNDRVFLDGYFIPLWFGWSLAEKSRWMRGLTRCCWRVKLKSRLDENAVFIVASISLIERVTLLWLGVHILSVCYSLIKSERAAASFGRCVCYAKKLFRVIVCTQRTLVAKHRHIWIETRNFQSFSWLNDSYLFYTTVLYAALLNQSNWNTSNINKMKWRI